MFSLYSLFSFPLKLLSWQQGAKRQRHVSEPKVSSEFYFTLKHKPCPQTSTGKHNQAFSAQSHPSGPLFLLSVFTFPSTIRHKLFMAKLLLTMFMQRLVQWHPFSAGASGHSCNTNNHDDSNNNNSQLCFSYWASTSSVLSHIALTTVSHYKLLVSARGHFSVNLPHPLEQEKKNHSFAFQAFLDLLQLFSNMRKSLIFIIK